MILYQYRVRDEFERVRGIAERVRGKFTSGASVEELLPDRELLYAAYDRLKNLLPAEVNEGNFGRHLAWMKKCLEENKPRSAQGDIDDICDRDLPSMEKGFRDSCASYEHYDREFSKKIDNLLFAQELDSAIRKAFVLLKERLVKTFNLSPTLDGRDLVNQVFGKAGSLAGKIPEPERESMRNLLDGLFGVFRNPYDHQNIQAEWYEADAVLAMVNWALKRVDSYASS